MPTLGEAADKVKLWLFPSIATLLGVLMWRMVNNIDTKLDLVLERTLVSQTEITNLKVDVTMLKTHVYRVSSNDLPNPLPTQGYNTSKLELWIPDDKWHGL